MPTHADRQRLMLDDAGLTTVMAHPGFAVRLSIEGYPRIRCRLPGTWSVGDCRLDLHLMYAVFSGSLVVMSHGSEIVARAGDALLLPPNVPFAARSGAGWVRLARMRFSLKKSTRVLAWGDGPRLWRGVEGIEPVIAVAEALLLRPRQHANEHHAVFALLHAALGRAGGSTALTPAQIDGLRRQVATDPTCTPADLARALDLSHDYATRLITRGLGQPPRAFILSERLRLAADRLAAGTTPADVATALGWRDHKLFLRQFRKAYGLPPGRWLRHLA